MEALEAQFQAAATAVDIAGAVVVGSDAKGKHDFYYAKAFGVHSLKEGGPVEPLQLDATFFYASSTKLLTSIAALQCVQAGHFTLDEDITRLMPELKDIKILKGFDDQSGEPVLVDSTKMITLRKLLSHSSGLAYAPFNPLIKKWRAYHGQTAHTKQRALIEPIVQPLVCEPGVQYNYSPGPEIAGMMIARANNVALSEFMKTHIWEPLGIINMTFHLEQRLDMKKRMPEVSLRQGGSHPLFLTVADPNGKLEWGTNPYVDMDAIQEDDEGGTGAFGSAVDFHKVLHSVVSGDGKLLNAEMCDELFKPQLSPEAQEHVVKLYEYRDKEGLVSFAPSGKEISFSLSGMLNLSDVEGRRRAGTMVGGGITNTMWWADRKAKICGFYGSNLLPLADPKSVGLAKAFEAAMYAREKESLAKRS
ncbi:beta-lactamase/transpeptidase-like protein [Stipitochalara longipes BDJ]|nr:beta-lactamase/transpeptidase-like protein [Stipitochalara longipes BDJ]